MSIYSKSCHLARGGTGLREGELCGPLSYLRLLGFRARCHLHVICVTTVTYLSLSSIMHLSIISPLCICLCIYLSSFINHLCISSHLYVSMYLSCIYHLYTSIICLPISHVFINHLLSIMYASIHV